MPDQLLARLDANERALVQTCEQLMPVIAAKQRITPAGEWLLDNFYLIEEQIRTARHHLPKGYSLELPALIEGVSAGLPRVYDLALETIAHGDGRVDPDSLSRFIAAYQTVTPLRLGELWAIPIMLRLALIENLRRVAVHIGAGRGERDLAVSWTDALTDIARQDPKNLILVIADMARSNPPMSAPFVSEFARRLQGQGPALALPLTWMEQQLAETGLSIEQLVRVGNQQQAADQVSISNSIGSLRFLGTMDWREFVESMSVVEGTLRGDPGGAYAGMDFASRDRYRHAVEAIAKSSRLAEDVVAARAIELARTGADEGMAHVGYYLIGPGRLALEGATHAHLALGARLRRWASRSPLLLYVGAITLLTLLIAAGLSLQAWTDGAADWLLVVTGVLALLAGGQLATALVNWLATLLASPHPLPRMDYATGIPAASRALVVVPTMLTSPHNIDSLVEALEVRFLANRDDNLRFALLTDLRDAAQESLPQDAPLLELARARIEALNARYGSGGNDIFFLLHRPRRWNPHDKVWMGYERKRGKLAELNSLLLEGKREGFSLVVGDIAALAGVKYVITLDTDTQLPRDAARQFVGAMAHPLNRPVHDATLGRVRAGYGILQPRVSVSLPGTSQSRYARLNGGEPGIDPYTRAVSDVYQDVFQEGSFIGKGIYDVHAFEQALKGRFPENRILSHDLLEGCYARAGLLSDVQLYEEYPARYGADVNRRYRWIRGDWQLASWLLPRVPGPDGRRRKNTLSLLSRWKLADNLRRSLVPVALTLLLVLGWTAFFSPLLWTLAVLGVLLIPPLLATLLDLVRKPDDMRPAQHLAAAAQAAGQRFVQAGFALATLPHEAFYSLDAILRTLGRLLFTHQRLLEWNPSGDQELQSRSDLVAAFRTMAFAPVLAVGTSIALVTLNPAALLVAGPILLLWLASPVLAWWISLPLARREVRLTADQTRFLGRIARKTWAFFETFVGPDDHWLPPDNYQEYRAATLAHRTSPTNMGLALLANLSAHDFGYIPTGQLIERSAGTLETMAGLERHRGHFYNWYDTQSLRPLHPMYISTVDSGNLAGHLLTLRPGLLALLDLPILEPRCLAGLRDTLEILEELAGERAPTTLAQYRRDLKAAFDTPPATLSAMRVLLDRLAQSAEIIAAHFGQEPESQTAWWARALARQGRAVRDELAYLAPWAELPDAPDGFGGFAEIDAIPTLRTLAGLALTWSARLASGPEAGATPVHAIWLVALRRDIAQGSERAQVRIATIQRLALLAGEMADMEYGFLYDKAARLLAIGYNVDDRRRDTSYYDLLASEARLSVFIAIAQGQLPQDSWFALGRLLTSAGGEPILLSWSGSMFEYLMPQLVMPNYEHTLLDQTLRAAVARQIEYGQQLGLPWGMSESGYNTVDLHLNYQYRAFGVPGLGLKRGLGEDRVVAPYASVMALMVAPEAACQNLQRLSALGAEGQYGFFEAIDYTPVRQRRGESHALVRSYMAHHQGMSLLALAWLLRDRPMQQRFTADPLLQATLLLLQERIPRASEFYTHIAELSGLQVGAASPEMPIRVLNDPDTPVPEVQLLSNGRYHVMLTQAGGGYSRWNDLAMTRWREDGVRDPWGTFTYLCDVASGSTWSTAHQPMLRRAEHYEAIFSEGRAEFRRRDRGDDFDFDTHTDIVVSPEDDIELRRVRITNRADRPRTIEVTSYAEVVLATPAADALHPAFSNLFVQTEIVAPRQAILCTRRPRSREEHPPWMFHLMSVHDAEVESLSFETDRARFLGRGRGPAAPLAMEAAGALSGGQGSVLDPVVAIRCRITLASEQSASVDLVYGIGASRDAVLALVEKYQDRRLADRVFELAWTHAQVLLRQINANEADAQLYGRLANSILHAHAGLRADGSVLTRNRRGQSGLWGYAISGDLPIVLVRIADLANIELVRQLIQAHAYWRLKGLVVDLVIWNEDRAGYRQALQDHILALVAVGLESQVIDRPGGIFIRSVEQISEEDRVLFQTVARVILSDSRGTLAEQLDRPGPPVIRVPRLQQGRPRPEAAAAFEPPQRELILANGLGGFTPDGREYVITTTPDQLTPAPWVNVLANPRFGSVISESGQAYTWGENAHEFRLTPWHNDPVSDPGGEAFYLRDEETGEFWSPTPLPRRGATPYVSRHGFGYSVFEHTESGIRSELWVYVATDAAVKFSVLKVRNLSGRPRRLSATGYVEWVLGDLGPKSAMHVTTEVDSYSGALYARNPYNTEFPDRVAFFDVDDGKRTFTCDRAEFIGRNGSLANPAALRRTHLSGRLGSALDPCAALQVGFNLDDGQEREIVFRLGVGGTPNGEDANRLVHRFRGNDAARRALEEVWHFWNHSLGAVQVETPDESLNVLSNGWLLYQTLACRMWARSGYYQSGGAFGFRDQLQDAMALVHAEPGLLRAQLLLAASRQFREGDVQHWWHPPAGRGVRTHCSDDYLWLALATSRYVLSCGDTGVLEEAVPFLEGRPLNADDESYYDLPGRSEGTESLYQHCVRAIRHGLRFGEHGLPLMGSGDWNDGMNRVGIGGKGESVWLGFFLIEVLGQFGTLARRHGDPAFAEFCAAEGDRLRRHIEQHAWDGAWYRRAWFDDGTPLGAAANAECQIDSLSQSWAVLSGAGDPQRARRAMQAVDERLVRRESGLVQLLDPPFDKTDLDPGYIKGYVPGVRENGGQYTHAAIWAAMAFAAQGDSRRAWEITTLINPANHAKSKDAIATYKVEPYVMAADVYAVAPHTGRGGWSWYTGSAGWMYRLIVESLLGLRLEVDKLHVAPCLPAHWPGYKVHYRYRETVYHIAVVQLDAAGLSVDGVEMGGLAIPLVDDHREHTVEVRLKAR
ncbi:MAG: carbohydrate binding:glycosyltransferase 36:glycosyltransferase 36 associated [bacterium]|nr:MAG: carbohydrate binding:glycosyltransferase 36:glycosyltransferase 36 associated [bacterium]KAF0148508.1 MAG: carbohydrate binding:glycosyltransferase 36:glycosyltransferase 36 associated [bacterium]KAF0168052.1 MAG: carbohydrate binding:glycosyltransferase 36:glycosyltransferase 36 associated [bacterium]TXT21203.1 MAG: carbohydrate binding:glycosyltransferase 36:glycosyltransferase 36 associated [bacterium]